MYNVRLKHYQNGETQARIYCTGIVTGQKKAHPKPSVPEMEKEPFTGTMVEVVRSFHQAEEKRERSIHNSLTRAKQQIYDISRANKWDYFVTLTFNEKKVDRYDYSACTKKLSVWLSNMKLTSSPDFKYIVVPERHKDGAFHFHGLFAHCDGLQIIDSGHKDKKGKTVYNIGKYKLGWTTATKVENNSAVTKYITKYTTKELIENTKGKKKYWCSRNCDRPILEDLLLSIADKELLHEELLETSDYFKVTDFGYGVKHNQVRYYEHKNLTINVPEETKNYPCIE